MEYVAEMKEEGVDSPPETINSSYCTTNLEGHEAAAL